MSRPGSTGEPAAAGEGRTILHVDMDAFYAAVEVLADPTLAGRPVIVGGAGPRGVVASCSYEARAFGVHSAMPSVQARRLCPNAVFLAGRYDTYAETSRRLHEIFNRWTPLVEGISLDEAFLDVTGARRLLGTGPEIASALRETVRAELGLSCSVGVAPSKFLAKLASKAAKPRARRDGIEPGAGVVIVAAGEELEFLHPLPVWALWGVGPATRARLERFGVRTVADLAALPLPTLIGALGTAAGRQLHELSWARDPRPVEPHRPLKSVGHEETYPRDHHDAGLLAREIVRMADAVASRLRAAATAGRTVQLKVRFGDFTTVTRARTLDRPLDTGPEIAAVATALLAQVDVGPGVRLLGVSVSGLAGAGDATARQLTLDEAGERWSEASGAIDAIRARFGAAAVGPASLAGPGGVRVKRPGDTQWGPPA